VPQAGPKNGGKPRCPPATHRHPRHQRAAGYRAWRSSPYACSEPLGSRFSERLPDRLERSGESRQMSNELSNYRGANRQPRLYDPGSFGATGMESTTIWRASHRRGHCFRVTTRRRLYARAVKQALTLPVGTLSGTTSSTPGSELVLRLVHGELPVGS
jgi:hypothetical protein